MISINFLIRSLQRVIIIFPLVSAPLVPLNAQYRNRPAHKPPERISFGVHFNPVISWFHSNIEEVENQGARPGFNLGISYNRYFSPNYSFSSGLNIINAGGRLVTNDALTLDLSKNNTSKTVHVPAGEAIIYRIQYASIPLGLKMQTNQIGYLSIFTDVGLDPKVVLGGKVDIPSLDLKNEGANPELRLFNLSYHINAGIEYALGGTTAFIAGLGFDNNFFDVTKDINDQPDDRVTHKLLSFRFGINF